MVSGFPEVRDMHMLCAWMTGSPCNSGDVMRSVVDADPEGLSSGLRCDRGAHRRQLPGSIYNVVERHYNCNLAGRLCVIRRNPRGGLDSAVLVDVGCVVHLSL